MRKHLQWLSNVYTGTTICKLLQIRGRLKLPRNAEMGSRKPHLLWVPSLLWVALLIATLLWITLITLQRIPGQMKWDLQSIMHNFLA